uniref:FYVE-type domain-containing protein n=1 Tax=Peronospora matthiolae TaxID=2874970 RepID=A0AAV1TFD0_9STRA
MHSRFPLPDDFFPEIHLTSAEIKNYEVQMQDIVENALTEYELHEAKGSYPVYRSPWSLVNKVESLTTIKKEISESSTTSEARIFGRMNGNYRHFIDFFYAETSAELFTWNQFMFGHATDAAVLKNIYTVASGKKCLYMGIKWTCLNPSQLVKKRDNCYMEYLIYTKDLRGRDVGIRVTLPLDIPECPEMPKRFKTKRIRLNTVWISRPADRESNVTEFFMMSQNNFNGLAVTASYYKRMMNILINMAVFVDSRRILVLGVMARKGWAKSSSRKSCSVCSRKFGPTRHRHHCRLCGDLICRRCAVVRDAPKDERPNSPMTSSRTFDVVKTKFCVLCVTKMRSCGTNALVPALDGNISIADCEKTNLGNSCAKVPSETESEGGRTSVFSLAGSTDGSHQSLQMSPEAGAMFDSDVGMISFVSNLDMSDDESVTILADHLRSTNGIIAEEVAEVVDTMNTVPVLSFDSTLQRGRSTQNADVVDDNDAKTGSNTGFSWPPLSSKNSPRSLDQCLAEQEELLRRMLSASSLRHQNVAVTAESGLAGQSGCNFFSGTPLTKARVGATLFEC